MRTPTGILPSPGASQTLAETQLRSRLFEWRGHGCVQLQGALEGTLERLRYEPGADPAPRDPSVVVTTPPEPAEPAGWAAGWAARGSAGQWGHHPPPLILRDVEGLSTAEAMASDTAPVPPR